MTVVAIGTFVPIREHHETVRVALSRAAEASQIEPGCELYALHQSRTRFVLVEQWRDRESLNAHAQGTAFRTLTSDLEGLLDEPLQVQVVSPVPVGTRDRGVLRG